MRETTGPDEPGAGRVGDLVGAWTHDRLPFDDWVRGVSRSYFTSRFRLEGAAKLLGTTPVELQAVLNLATLDDDDLHKFADSQPPKTTWLSFALATSIGIDAGLAALETLPTGDSPFHAVEDALRAAEGPSVLQRVAELPGATIAHMASKAKQYDQLRPQDRKALVDFGVRKRTGRPLTPRQVAYLYGLLQQLVDGGAIRRESPDGDRDECDAVLDALSN